MYELLQLTANFGKLKFVEINGRQFAIAPIRILMPRVLNGSAGALYYPPEEISKNIADWNGKPLVVRHPNLKGNNVSAHLPEIFATQEVGRIYNAKLNNDHSLSVDGYFDVEMTRRIDSRVWNALINHEKIEVSTGLYTDNEPAQANANHDGTPYTFIARNYRPDHLAILPDEKGACSCEDGCGVFNEYDKQQRVILANWLVDNFASPTNNPSWVGDHDIWMRAKEQAAKEGHSEDYEYVAALYKKMGGKVLSDTDTNNSSKDQTMNRDYIIGLLIANCAAFKSKPAESKTKLDALKDNELKEIILENKETLVDNAAKEPENGDGKFFEWMMNADSDIRSAFVKHMKKKMLAQTGTLPETPKPTAPVETEEEKKKREEQEALKKAEAATANQQKPMNITLDMLPTEDREAVQNAKEIVAAEKKRLIDRLTAHITDASKKQSVSTTLNSKSLADLRERVDLLPPVANQQQGAQPLTGGNIALPDFFGAIGAGGQTYNAEAMSEDVLEIPTHDYSK